MTAPDTTLDRPLHLTLPDWRTALKRRVKRPKRPSGWTVFWAVYVVWCGWQTIAGLLAADPARILCNAPFLAAGYWCLTHGKRGMPIRLYLGCCAIWIPTLALLIAGVIS